MKAVQRLFIIALAVCVILSASLGTLIYVSLIPFFHEIGLGATVLLGIIFACVATLCISFTYNRVSVWASDRRQKQLLSRVVIVGEMAAYLSPTGQWEHLSARHEMAKIPPAPLAIEAPKTSDLLPDADAVMELHDGGRGLRDIADDLHTTFHQVQKVYAAESKKREKAKAKKTA